MVIDSNKKKYDGCLYAEAEARIFYPETNKGIKEILLNQ